MKTESEAPCAPDNGRRIRRLVGLLTMFVAVVATTLGLTTGTASATTSTFTWTSAQSGKCIDVPYGTTSSGAWIWQANCVGGNNNQLFYYSGQKWVSGIGYTYQMKSNVSGLCLASHYAYGAFNLVQAPCNDNDNLQFWSFPSAYSSGLGRTVWQIKNAYNGRCVDNQNSTDNGHYLVLNGCYWGGNMAWY
jgi:hypothetical protein